MKTNHWQFWIDRGGTFTDVVALSPAGQLLTEKLLSENPQQYADAAIEGIRKLLSSMRAERAQVAQPSVSGGAFTVKMGTTVATNALLERKGEPTLLVITKGFADALRIGYQNRPELFSLQIALPDMLYCQVVEAEERIDASGRMINRLNQEHLRTQLTLAYQQGLRSVAIVFMHAYLSDRHEKLAADIAGEVGFEQISISSGTSPLMKLVSRGDTTVVDAYLSPILRRYVQQVETELAVINPENNQLLFMQSNGGLTEAHQFKGKDAILSGPAGGVVGMVKTATAAGFTKLIGFDMGGTSTDVYHYAGDYERAFETQVAGVRMRAPMMRIHTVAAGGGSILHFDSARFRVGPDSAGACPGPAAYGRNGPLCVTDCNLLLGKIQQQYFPQVFGDGANQPLNLQIVKKKFTALCAEIEQTTGTRLNEQEAASGFLTIAIENMANAIKKISLQRGYNVAQYTLCCFGGAGGQHACLVADALAIKRIFLHPLAGVLSAYGMGLADLRQIFEQSIEHELTPELMDNLTASGGKLFQKGKLALLNQGAEDHQISSTTWLHCCYSGSDTSLTVPLTTYANIISDFDQQHRQSFGFSPQHKALIVQSLQVETIAKSGQPIVSAPVKQRQRLKAQATHPVYCATTLQDTPFYERSELPVDQWLQGPAVITEATGTIFIEPGWRGQLRADNNIVLERYLALPNRVAPGTRVNPVMLEIFNNLFMSIAEQMGLVLEKTAVSVNIKERLDFSCAIFDVSGDLVANAPHMPVHLGSMSESIKSVCRRWNNKMTKGDAFVLNAPYNGGTHLPDITIIKPVFSADNNELIFYVAARGHHADIGGISPGSMPADSSHVDEEGVLLNNLRIVKAGRFLENEIRQVLTSNRWPARNPEANIADLKAQLAACEIGMRELLRTIGLYGLDVVQAYMTHVQHNAEASVQKVLDVLQDGSFRYAMDNGSHIQVAIRVDKKNRQADIDFSGTSPQHPGNFNAPSAIVRAAVLYVFRCLVKTAIPLNEGCLKPLNIILPKASIISPEYPAAVVAGNVETSQAIVDTLLGALNITAASQGTMNNVTWGNENFQYYETLCGGEGASEGHHGCSAVHTHMTNSRLTDPEVLEWRFPVTLKEFAIRPNSGGHGQWRGGDGVTRKLRFNEAMSLSLLTGHRKIPPYGINGGDAGKPGKNLVERKDGSVQELGSTDSTKIQAGDALIIETPGGGGFGKKT